MWRFDQQYLGNRAAGGMSNKMGCFDSENVHQIKGVRGHLLKRIANARLGASPRAAMVMDDHPEVLREGLYLGLPVVANATESSNKHEREALAVLLIVDLASFDFCCWHGLVSASSVVLGRLLMK